MHLPCLRPRCTDVGAGEGTDHCHHSVHIAPTFLPSPTPTPTPDGQTGVWTAQCTLHLSLLCPRQKSDWRLSLVLTGDRTNLCTSRLRRLRPRQHRRGLGGTGQLDARCACPSYAPPMPTPTQARVGRGQDRLVPQCALRLPCLRPCQRWPGRVGDRTALCKWLTMTRCKVTVWHCVRRSGPSFFHSLGCLLSLCRYPHCKNQVNY